MVVGTSTLRPESKPSYRTVVVAVAVLFAVLAFGLKRA